MFNFGMPQAVSWSAKWVFCGFPLHLLLQIAAHSFPMIPAGNISDRVSIPMRLFCSFRLGEIQSKILIQHINSDVSLEIWWVRESVWHCCERSKRHRESQKLLHSSLHVLYHQSTKQSALQNPQPKLLTLEQEKDTSLPAVQLNCGTLWHENF